MASTIPVGSGGTPLKVVRIASEDDEAPLLGDEAPAGAAALAAGLHVRRPDGVDEPPEHELADYERNDGRYDDGEQGRHGRIEVTAADALGKGAAERTFGDHAGLLTAGPA